MNDKTTLTWVSGAKYDGRQEVIKTIAKDFYAVPVTLLREPENKHDPNAIKIVVPQGEIGYIKRDEAKLMAPLLDADPSAYVAAIADVKKTEKGNLNVQISLYKVKSSFQNSSKTATVFG